MKNLALGALILMVALLGFGCAKGGSGGEQADSVNEQELDQLSNDLDALVKDVEENQSSLNTLESESKNLEEL